jgi:hypothetical protein
MIPLYWKSTYRRGVTWTPWSIHNLCGVWSPSQTLFLPPSISLPFPFPCLLMGKRPRNVVKVDPLVGFGTVCFLTEIGQHYWAGAPNGRDVGALSSSNRLNGPLSGTPLKRCTVFPYYIREIQIFVGVRRILAFERENEKKYLKSIFHGSIYHFPLHFDITSPTNA